jgi:F-type H+-transporting ATPase subunit epsilon
MRLGVYTIEKTLFEGEVEKIIARTAMGEITVLNHHIPLVSRLEVGEVRITTPEKQETILNVQGGFIEVRPENKSIILAEQKSF